MRNKTNIDNLLKENENLKRQVEEKENAETIKQHFCSTCVHGIYYTDYCCTVKYLCELDHPCNNYEKKPEK